MSWSFLSLCLDELESFPTSGSLARRLIITMSGLENSEVVGSNLAKIVAYSVIAQLVSPGLRARA